MKNNSLTRFLFLGLILWFTINLNIAEAKMKTYEDLADLIKNASTSGVVDFEEELKNKE
jgi:hypothetical protein